MALLHAKQVSACSMFVLASCNGFDHSRFHMWCCTANQCDIKYTEEALEDLGLKPKRGFGVEDGLEPLTCHHLGNDRVAGPLDPRALEDGSDLPNPTEDASIAG
jgi:hypothetical protein